MIGFNIGYHSVVVTAGINEEVTKNVIKVIKDQNVDGTTEWFPVTDGQFPMLTVVETNVSNEGYNTIRGILEGLYPGVCKFDPDKL